MKCAARRQGDARMITDRDRADLKAWLETQDLYCATPDLLDALIQLFRSLEDTYEPRNHHQATTQNGQ